MSTIQEFDFSANLLRALLWRHNNAPNLQQLLQDKQDFFDSANVDFWEDWIRDVFDLRTANTFGLGVWSIILGINITIGPQPEAANVNFGFGEFRKNFLNGNFTAAGGDAILGEESARLILRLRYYQLTTNGNVLDINKILADVFGDLGSAYVVDNLDMTITYIFNFDLSSDLLTIFDVYDILPRPAGVEILISTELENTDFGFGDFRKNFEHGNFEPE